MHAITVTDLHKTYGPVHALDGVSFAVPSGRLFGLVGADGAGKSTLLRILATLVDADKGSATLLGRDVARQYRQVREVIGYMPQKFSLYPDLSVMENMLFFADVFCVPRSELQSRVDRLLSFSHLGPFRDRRARNLSGGMKQKLALSCALIHTPQALILDEPTTGVDPVSRKEFWDILRDLRGQGVTIVISTPYMEEAELCDELLFLHRGSVVCTGTPEHLRHQYPHPLFKIAAQGDQTLSYPANGAVPQGIAFIYPAQGSLRVATTEKGMDEAEVLKRVKTVIPLAHEARRVEPDIEDLFICLLSSGKDELAPPLALTPVGRADLSQIERE